MNDDRRLRYPMYGTFAFWLTACPDTWFYTDDASVTKEWGREYCDNVEVFLCYMHDGPVFRGRYIDELSAARSRMLHMHHILPERTWYRENIHDAECIRENSRSALQAPAFCKNTNAQNHKGCSMWILIFWLSSPLMSPRRCRQPTLAVHGQEFRTEKACRDAFSALKKENVENSLSGASASPAENKPEMMILHRSIQWHTIPRMSHLHYPYLRRMSWAQITATAEDAEIHHDYAGH